MKRNVESNSELNRRRDFLKFIVAGGAATLVAVGNFLRYLMFIPTNAVRSSEIAWPILKIANVRSLELLKPFRFNYPLIDTPNILVRLGTKVENGVGPNEDIVAFSNICQHLGCFYDFLPSGGSPSCNPSYKASSMEGYCCCHGSRYDFTHDAKVIGGPAPTPVPRVILKYDEKTEDIYAVGMGSPTIFGHGPQGTSDPKLVLKYDLEGGDIVK
jgi:arsenite oxidase small subunit